MYRSMAEVVKDLRKQGECVALDLPLDPQLEMAEIHRRAYENGGPAVYFPHVQGSPFPAVSNLFGTWERTKYLLRHGMSRTKKAVLMKADPTAVMKQPWKFWDAPLAGWTALPRPCWRAPVMANETQLDQLPGIQSWPDDGGPFITLPQVYSEDPDQPGFMKSNLGMYRVQMNGNDYEANREIGLHYQIHRSIGIHHSRAAARGENLKVAVFVGGHPAHAVAAVMPLPDGLSELHFAGMLAGRAFRYKSYQGWRVSADADFCILGEIEPTRTKPEGPFGDHLGYYSLVHDFPVMRVRKVFHQQGAVWPFTVVGRPPQEDTQFGKLIHELTGPMVPVSIPGVQALHAVDAAGVHPLLLAIGNERYVPYGERVPQELLTNANAILGFGQASLAKYLIIAAHQDNEQLDINNEQDFFRHVLERVDWRRDLHFQTKTTIDTLDYSGEGLNQGSKVVIAAAGDKKRELLTELTSEPSLPSGFSKARIGGPGILIVQGPAFTDLATAASDIARFSSSEIDLPEGCPLIIVADDAEFTAHHWQNFLWVTFTRSNPSHDIYGVDQFIEHKHWGCRGALIIDARRKPQHAPPLIGDARIAERVDQLADTLKHRWLERPARDRLERSGVSHQS